MRVSASELPGHEYFIAVHGQSLEGLPTAEYWAASDVIRFAAHRWAHRADIAPFFERKG